MHIKPNTTHHTVLQTQGSVNNMSSDSHKIQNRCKNSIIRSAEERWVPQSSAAVFGGHGDRWSPRSSETGKQAAVITGHGLTRDTIRGVFLWSQETKIILSAHDFW